MTPNTLRIALGLLLFGAAPVAVAVFPQQAISDTHMTQSEPPAAAAEPAEMDQPAAAAELAEVEQPMTITEQSIWH
ncbi:MAG: hypothetical protein WBA99_07675 [Nodosilinea sp.]